MIISTRHRLERSAVEVLIPEGASMIFTEAFVSRAKMKAVCVLLAANEDYGQSA
jgi:hypothetical protein